MCVETESAVQEVGLYVLQGEYAMVALVPDGGSNEFFAAR